jgi:hypothetical protein
MTTSSSNNPIAIANSSGAIHQNQFEDLPQNNIETNRSNHQQVMSQAPRRDTFSDNKNSFTSGRSRSRFSFLFQ